MYCVLAFSLSTRVLSKYIPPEAKEANPYVSVHLEAGLVRKIGFGVIAPTSIHNAKLMTHYAYVDSGEFYYSSI